MTILQGQAAHAKDDAIEGILTEVLKVQEIIQKLDEEILYTFDNDKDVTNEIGNNYQYHDTIKAFIETLKSRIPNKNSKEFLVEKSKNNLKPQVKLPKMDIKKFYGNILEWFPFWETFKSTIHDSDLNDIDKLNYLCAYLDGDALKLLNGLPRNASNYKVALELLNEKYGNKQVITNMHVNKLYNLKPIQNNMQLSYFYETLDSNFRALEALGMNIENFDCVLAPFLLN